MSEKNKAGVSEHDKERPRVWYFIHCLSKDSNMDSRQYKKISEKTEKLDASDSRGTEVCRTAETYAYCTTHASSVGNVGEFFYQGPLLTKSLS